MESQIVDTGTYLLVIRKFPRQLTYVILHSFFSGLGQTFLIALFVPFLQASNKLSNAAFGTYYGLATLTSALCLPFIGGLIDRIHLRHFSLLSAIIVAAGWGLLACDCGLWSLCAGIFFVRLGGQALMSHVTTTATSRYFSNERGKALAIGNLGYPLSEGLLPVVVLALLSIWSWQGVAFGLLVSIFLIFLPLIYGVLTADHSFLFPQGRSYVEQVSDAAAAGATSRQVFSHPYVYMVIPLLLTPPFLCTGLFFYQSQVAELTAWPLQLLVAGFAGYALARVLASFVCGQCIDRWGAWRLVGLGLMPFFLGLIVLISVKNTTGPWLYLCLLGLSTGWQSTVMGALWVEIYGTKHLGAIRSMLTPMMVMATALATPIFGWYFDQSDRLEPLVFATLGYILIATILAWAGTIYFRCYRDKLPWLLQQNQSKITQAD